MENHRSINRSFGSVGGAINRKTTMSIKKTRQKSKLETDLNRPVPGQPHPLLRSSNSPKIFSSNFLVKLKKYGDQHATRIKATFYNLASVKS